ncbi:hypothetical protein [Sanguibacter antarcticus]|uniref:Uncharacterized protein n=1 Tax=Sanguibacter antarcticus TaxID=372484 RepID=A0A2A9E8M5_9MICO|nr:hypothetical protein [Sanguibacter antarcticus]PFG34675.1 hypothetical protein ATL42_2595 [Sanguibacter antarcticus]
MTTTPSSAVRARRAGSLLLVVLCAALAGCTASPDASAPDTTSPGVTVLEYPAMLAEFRAEAATLQLPEGATWIEPAEPEPEPLPGGGMGVSDFEQGVGVGAAGNQWFCYWTRQWLAQRGVDPTAEAEALDVMNSYVDSRAFLETMDPASAQPLILDLLKKAALGDPSAAASYDDLSCKWWLAPNASAAS